MRPAHSSAACPPPAVPSLPFALRAVPLFPPHPLSVRRFPPRRASCRGDIDRRGLRPRFAWRAPRPRFAWRAPRPRFAWRAPLPRFDWRGPQPALTGAAQPRMPGPAVAGREALPGGCWAPRAAPLARRWDPAESLARASRGVLLRAGSAQRVFPASRAGLALGTKGPAPADGNTVMSPRRSRQKTAWRPGIFRIPVPRDVLLFDNFRQDRASSGSFSGSHREIPGVSGRKCLTRMN